MNKTELIEAIAAKTDQPRAHVSAVFDGFTAVVAEALSKGDTVTLIGFGTFTVKNRQARTGRNPQTGQAMEIKASKSPAFKPGKAFKDAL
jgi:DNA-binding protein HU-beta